MVFLTAALGGGYMRHVAERQALARADLAATAAAQQSLRMLEAVDNLIAQVQLALRLRQAGQTMAAETVDDTLRAVVARGTAGVTQVGIVDGKGWLLWSSSPGVSSSFVGIPPFQSGLGDSIQVHSGAIGGSDGHAAGRGTLQFARAIADDSGHFQGFASWRWIR
ncbi:MAG TPA: hypothetical protein VGH36_02440 [Acetobacteraceae bacterium]